MKTLTTISATKTTNS